MMVEETERESAPPPPLAVVRTSAVLRAARRSGPRPVFWRVRDAIPRRLELGLLAASGLAPLLMWTLLHLSGSVNPIFLPSPTAVVSAGAEMLASGDLVRDTWASTQRVFFGFGLAVLISVPLGLAMGSFRSIRALFEPMIGLIRYAPATAFVPLLLIWLGLGEAPKIALVVLGTVFFNTLMTANVVWQVPSELIRVAQTFGAGSFTVFGKVIFPYAVPGIFDAARVNLAAAWNLIVVSELIAADQGLGFRIVRAQKFLHIDQIFVALVVIGLLGVASDLLLKTLRNRLAPWSQE
ncbi:MAG: ABC transporter permease [Chloroflexi bacterium]|nr:ABC transporter permease [Chloroflexota bacterium]